MREAPRLPSSGLPVLARHWRAKLERGQHTPGLALGGASFCFVLQYHGIHTSNATKTKLTTQSST
eukprot:2013372-Amphidinium_carterae.1